MQNEKIKAWVLVNIFDHGEIIEVDAEVHPGGELIWYKLEGGRSEFYSRGNNWHRTPEAAIACAEERRAAKIASLERQIERLKKLEFKV